MRDELLRVGVSCLVMNARRLVNSEFDFSGEKGQNSDSQHPFQEDESAAAIDEATEAADEMVAKSAVLVEMMEDLEERLRRRMANSTDPAPVYSRKVRRFQSLTRASEDDVSPFSDGFDRPQVSDLFDADSDAPSGH